MTSPGITSQKLRIIVEFIDVRDAWYFLSKSY
jgi:hypothetical protein